jgi:D-sedoheptulose 7-phosphate isomerase
LAFTGARPSPLAQVCDDTFGVHTPMTATVQEVHQVAVHLLCEAVDDELRTRGRAPDAKVIS